MYTYLNNIWLLATFLLLSCSESRPKTSYPKVQDSVVLSSKNENTQSTVLSESPVVIRSTPQGSFGANSDTAQISQYIRRIFQDSKGQLWFGTVGDGVCCYNGASLHYYTLKDGLAGTSVQDIAEDKKGNLWFGTNGGVSKFDGKNFTNFDSKNGLTSDHVQSLFLDRDGILWAGCMEGLCRSSSSSFLLDQKEKCFTFFPESPPFLFNLRNINQDLKGNIWLATQEMGAFCISGEKVNSVNDKNGPGLKPIRCILPDHEGLVWFATSGNGLIKYDRSAEFKPGTRIYDHYKDEKGSNEVETIFAERSGDLWISVRGAVRKYNRSSLRQGQKIYTEFSAANGLNNCCVQSIYEDLTGNIWFGSGAGLFLYDPAHKYNSCVLQTCKHNTELPSEAKEHANSATNTFVNVLKKGPWPQRIK